MSEPSLNYRSAAIERPSGTRAVGWISLFVLGTLYVLFGLLMASSFIFVEKSLTIGGAPSSVRNVVLAVCIGFSACLAILGVVEIILAFKVRKASRRAAVAGFALTMANAILLGILLLVGLIFMLPGGSESEVVLGTFFYLFPLACNIWTSHALFRVLKEMGKRARSLARAQASSPV